MGDALSMSLLYRRDLPLSTRARSPNPRYVSPPASHPSRSRREGAGSNILPAVRMAGNISYAAGIFHRQVAGAMSRNWKVMDQTSQARDQPKEGVVSKCERTALTPPYQPPREWGMIFHMPQAYFISGVARYFTWPKAIFHCSRDHLFAAAVRRIPGEKMRLPGVMPW